jgi:hypothetical protein
MRKWVRCHDEEKRLRIHSNLEPPNKKNPRLYNHCCQNEVRGILEPVKLKVVNEIRMLLGFEDSCSNRQIYNTV